MSHHYSRPPRSHIKAHRNLRRIESSVLFRLRANKCWAPGDNIGTAPAPPCSCDNTTPRDGVHIMVCPVTARLRPPDIHLWVNMDSRRESVLRWAEHHNYFGISLRTSQVRWISLARPGNLARSQTFTCLVCTRSFTNRSHLNRHSDRFHPDPHTSLFVIGQPHPCTRCTLIYNSKTELDQHTATTHGCPDCGKMFTEIANMYRHMIKKHGGLLCLGCSRRFATRIALRIHQRSNCGGSRS